MTEAITIEETLDAIQQLEAGPVRLSDYHIPEPDPTTVPAAWRVYVWLKRC